MGSAPSICEGLRVNSTRLYELQRERVFERREREGLVFLF